MRPFGADWRGFEPDMGEREGTAAFGDGEGRPRPVPVKRGGRLFGLGLMLLVLASGAAAGEKLTVFVTIPPLGRVLERIGGPHVEVHVLVDKGQSPHGYAPTPRQMAALRQADLYCSTGLPFEEVLLPKLKGTAKGLRVVHLAEGLIRLAEPHDDHDHAGPHEGDEHHGKAARGHDGEHHDAEHREHDEGEHRGHDHHDAHGEGELDPHVWLSPPLLRRMAERMADALREADPVHAEAYAANHAALDAELAAVHGRIAKLLAPHAGAPIFVFHPAFGHFARAYGLRQVAVETGGKEPTARRLAELIRHARKAKARVLFVQPQFPDGSARTVADAVGAAVVPLDPLAPDVIANFRAIAEALDKALAR